MKKRRFAKSTAMLLLSVLLCETVLPLHAFASVEEIRSQLAAVRNLAETDMETNSAAIGIILGQCIGQLSDDDPAKGTLQSIQILLESGNASSAAVCALLDSLNGEAGQTEEPEAGVPAGTQETEAGVPAGTQETEAGLPAGIQETEADLPADSEEPAAGEETGQSPSSPSVFPNDDAFFQMFAVYTNKGLPDFEVTNFAQTKIPPSVLVKVPGDWGNNAASGRRLISYSPVNGSGAINPKAGTLTISCFAMESEDPQSTFADYEKSIDKMNVTSGMQSEDISAANLPAKKLSFQMNVGANQFTCEIICFIFEETVYSIEMMQGQLSSFNYFPVFGQVVQSASVIRKGTAVAVEEETESTAETESAAGGDTGLPDAAETESAAETGNAEGTLNPDPSGTPASETGENETLPADENNGGQQQSDGNQPQGNGGQQGDGNQPQSDGSQPQGNGGQPQGGGSTAPESMDGSIRSFQYQLNGHTYQFPTPVSQIDPADLLLDKQTALPYDIRSDADMASGSWTEIINTEYFYFENSLYKEMMGITNMTGHDTVLSDGVLTALIDTNGTYLDIVLPGNIRVGSAEQDILRGFPEFANQKMDGTAAFIGNDYLYACNVRDDGCNGYVIIKNDAPFYSAVSIICENSLIREISFECLGSERAKGVFL